MKTRLTHFYLSVSVMTIFFQIFEKKGEGLVDEEGASQIRVNGNGISLVIIYYNTVSQVLLSRDTKLVSMHCSNRMGLVTLVTD